MRVSLRVVSAFVVCLGLPCVAAEETSPVTISENAVVQMDYTLTAEGEVVDKSSEGQPFQYVHGQGQIIPGLERQLTGLRMGDTKEITVTPEEGYGPIDPEAVVEIPKEQLPKTVTPEVGMVLNGVDPEGRPFRARIKSIQDTTVTLDLNHPLAGKTLLFKIKVLTITPPS